MAYKCLFLDNDVYTAQDVDDAISNICADGISGYPFDESALSGLNTAIAELTLQGVSYKGTSCLLVKVGTTYKISQGSAFMYDGTQIIFDSDGYVITPQAGVKQYIYLERDVLHNTINVVVSQQAGGQNTVPIAEIAANGAITDRRRFASANIGIMAEPKNISVTAHITETVQPNQSVSVDVGFNGWKYAITQIAVGRQCYKIEDGETISGFSDTPSDTRVDYSLSVTRNGSVLTIQNRSINAVNMDIDYELR